MEKNIEKKTNITEASEEIVESEIHYKELSPMRMVMRRFFRSRLSLVGVVMLIALFVFSFAGPPVLHAMGYQWQETETDWRRLVVRDDIDAIDITAPSNFHKEIAIAAAAITFS